MNAKRIKDMVGVFPMRRMLIQYGESHGNRNTAAYTITPDHTSFSQRDKAWSDTLRWRARHLMFS